MSQVATIIGSVGPVVDGLIRASVAATVFLGIVWASCRLVPRMSAAMRCGLWWCVGFRLVLDLVWIVPVSVPILPTTLISTPHASITDLPSPPSWESPRSRWFPCS